MEKMRHAERERVQNSTMVMTVIYEYLPWKRCQVVRKKKNKPQFLCLESTLKFTDLDCGNNEEVCIENV